MRPLVPVVLLLMASLSLAGCTVPEDEEAGDPLFGVCPQWVQGPWSEGFSASVSSDDPEATVTLRPEDANGTALLAWDGHPLDLYRIHLDDVSVPSGRLQLRAFSDEADRLKTIMDFREPGEPRRVPVLTLGADDEAAGQDFEVLLSSIAHGAEPAADALRMEWTFHPDGGGVTATVTGTVTAHYRVCGAPI